MTAQPSTPSPAKTSPYTARIESAWRAGGARQVEPRGGNMFTVHGRTGNRYAVKIAGPAARPTSYVCNCPAGSKERDCWHKAAAWLFLLSLSTVLR